MEKYPYSRVEPTLRRFHSVVDVHLDTLKQHKNNIEKYRACKDWSNLNKEQINASRTVQQIRSSLCEVQKTKNHIIDSDLDKFDAAITSSRQKAQNALIEFLCDERSAADFDHSSSGDPRTATSCSSLDNDYNTALRINKDDGEEDVTALETTKTQQCLNAAEDSSKEKAKESWFNLEKNVHDLKELMSSLSSAVYSQRSKVDSIEDHVEESHTNIRSGVEDLSVAAKLKGAVIPVTGAVLGGLVGGPVGLVVGAKIGLAAGVGGGALGYLGGQFVKNKKNSANDIAMQNLNAQLDDDK